MDYTLIGIIVGAVGLIVIAIIIFVRLSKIQKSIDSSVSQSIANYIDKIISSMSSLKEDYGQISNKLLTLSEISNDTKILKSYLTNPKMRGRWGERLVEDIINIVGLQENVNYIKQKTTEAGRPDFTFFLPNGKKINLDAKFSLDNYMKYIEAQNEIEKEQFRNEFLKDIKRTIKDVAGRDYVNAETVDFAIVFIASEAVYSFLLSEEANIIDEALSNKMVLCSPNNLYATLSVVRQATEYYALEKTSKEVLELMQKFNKEWRNFTTKFDKIDKGIDDLKRTFNEVSTTRKDKLDSVLNDIELKGKSVLGELPATEESEVNNLQDNDSLR